MRLNDDINETENENDTDDPESACYRTRTTEFTSSSVKCVDVCVEFDDNNTTNTPNRVCRSSPILESNTSENACERACVDAYYHSTSLKFHADEQKMKEYEDLRKETCKRECSRAFLSERGNEREAEDEICRF